MAPDLTTQFLAARRVGTPLFAVATADPAATIGTLVRASAATTPAILWDFCTGWTALNAPGDAAIRSVLTADVDLQSATGQPAEMLILARKLPRKTVLFVANAPRFLPAGDSATPGSIGFLQAVWNLRDVFKQDLRSLVLLGPSFTLPAELASDVLILDEPLPTAADHRRMAEQLITAANLTVPADTMDRAVAALCGLAAFPAEQVLAMSLADGGSGIDLDACWTRKVRWIESMPGLSVWQGRERLSDVAGVATIKSFLGRLLTGRDAPEVIVLIDEMEKAFAGSAGPAQDSSGVSTGMLGTMLSYMQDTNATGAIFLGPPGAGKTLVAKAAGRDAGRLVLTLDLGGMKAGLVGESEKNLRQALKVITAVGNGRALFLGTCNRLAGLPPELRRRFRLGTFFFDLPSADERAALWTLYISRYGWDPQRITWDDVGWTGHDIASCCELAYRLDLPLADAATYIVPVYRSAPTETDALRRACDGRFLSASYPGVFRCDSIFSTPAERTVALDGSDI